MLISLVTRSGSASKMSSAANADATEAGVGEALKINAEEKCLRKFITLSEPQQIHPKRQMFY